MHFATVLKKTMVEDQCSSFFRKDKLPARAEAYIVGRSRLLYVREISAVKGCHVLNGFYLKERSKPNQMDGAQPPSVVLKEPKDAGEGACAPLLPIE